jgi:hypothetical protein
MSESAGAAGALLAKGASVLLAEAPKLPYNRADIPLVI